MKLITVVLALSVLVSNVYASELSKVSKKKLQMDTITGHATHRGTQTVNTDRCWSYQFCVGNSPYFLLLLCGGAQDSCEKENDVINIIEKQFKGSLEQELAKTCPEEALRETFKICEEVIISQQSEDDVLAASVLAYLLTDHGCWVAHTGNNRMFRVNAYSGEYVSTKRGNRIWTKDHSVLSEDKSYLREFSNVTLQAADNVININDMIVVKDSNGQQKNSKLSRFLGARFFKKFVSAYSALGPARSVPVITQFTVPQLYERDIFVTDGYTQVMWSSMINASLQQCWPDIVWMEEEDFKKRYCRDGALECETGVQADESVLDKIARRIIYALRFMGDDFGVIDNVTLAIVQREDPNVKEAIEMMMREFKAEKTLLEIKMEKTNKRFNIEIDDYKSRYSNLLKVMLLMTVGFVMYQCYKVIAK